jgi:hypothetical protein
LDGSSPPKQPAKLALVLEQIMQDQASSNYDEDLLWEDLIDLDELENSKAF